MGLGLQDAGEEMPSRLGQFFARYGCSSHYFKGFPPPELPLAFWIGSFFTMEGPSEQLCRRPTGAHASGQIAEYRHPRLEAFSRLFQKGPGPGG